MGGVGRVGRGVEGVVDGEACGVEGVVDGEVCGVEGVVDGALR